MALDKFGLGILGFSGTLGGLVRKRHFYATNDSLAAVTTDGYFDPVAEQFTPGKGDVIEIAYALSGTAGVRTYVVNRNGTDITLTLSIATAAA